MLYPASTASTPDIRRTRRADGPVLSFKSGERERHLKLSPVTIAALSLVLGSIVIGLISTSAFLLLGDDVVNVTLARQARMQHAYEDRITALRAQVDLVTSRQLLDQQAVEDRVSALMARQDEIGEQQRKALKLLRRASDINAMALPTTEPRKLQKGIRFGDLTGSTTPFNKSVITANADVFDTLEASLEETERAQLAELVQLKQSADKKVKKLAKILTKQGIALPQEASMGGPLIELKGGNKFLNSVNALDVSLQVLEKVRSAANRLPHGSPAPKSKISSNYGSRRDPFTGRSAMHSGLDFKAKRGTPVLATASGVVIKAGTNGGYGRMVEIDHGGGITTRYAHLHRITVKKGQRVKRGQRVGKVGSTGRSTGPHLHYEVRRKKQALNPIHYVRLEKHMRPYF